MILSELIPFLKNLETRPKRSLSQNFLIDPNIVLKIIELAKIDPGEPVLEIGPGPGALTKALLDAKGRVFAVEMDPVFAKELQRLQNGNLAIFQDDFLKFPMELLPKKIKVVANLPYHITAPILEKLFGSSFSKIVIMVQAEVADRMKAAPGSKDYGSLSLFTQFHTKVSGSFRVPAACFYPKPKVDSKVISLDSVPLPEINPFPLIRQAFQKRRKMLTSSLLQVPKERLLQSLSDLGVRTDARPEMISLEQWLQLAGALLEAESFPGNTKSGPLRSLYF